MIRSEGAAVSDGRTPAPASRFRLGNGWLGTPPSFVRRIAVCITGEFRHVHHRTPEHHVRQLLRFLTGVDCDIFVHGWHNSSEALIVSELRPRSWQFEPRPSMERVAHRIRHVEPNIKPGRDAGSLSMFYSWQKCFALVEPMRHEYSHVLRIRPDLSLEGSLLEILRQIDRAGALPGSIYVPHMFHSKGVNDQVAFGPIEAMATYFATLDHVIATIDTQFFNPETALLRNLVWHEVPISFMHLPYGLMREVPVRINTVHERFSAQAAIWWSRTEWLPIHRDLSTYFAQKLRAVDAMMRQKVPALLYLRVPVRGGGTAVVRTRAIDNDPVVPAYAIWRRFGLPMIGSFVIADGAIEARSEDVRQQVFLYREGEQVILSTWREEAGALRNDRIVVPAADTSPTAGALRVPIRLALRLQKWSKRWRGNRTGAALRGRAGAPG